MITMEKHITTKYSIMKQAILVLPLLLFSLSLLSANVKKDDARSSASDIQPFSGNYSYAASSPVNIQLPDFSLTADSGPEIRD